MKENALILPFNGYAVDVYRFDGKAEVFLEKVHAVEITRISKSGELRTGAVVRSVFANESQPEHVLSLYIDDKFNVFDGEDNVWLIENDSLLSAMKSICEKLANDWTDLETKVESIAFNLGSLDRKFSLRVGGN